jgi:hypothetical protein
MPRIVARQPDGTVLVAVGHAGLIVHPDDYIPVIREHMPIASVHALVARPGWEKIDEPVPEGLLAEVHFAAMREFDRREIETAPSWERELLERTRPETGD